MNMVKKNPVDNSVHHRKTEFLLKDRLYNRIVDRYGVKGNPWQTSDSFVWRGSIYELPSLVGYVVQILFFWWLAMLAIRFKGDGDPLYGVIAIAVFILVRLAMILKQLVAQRKELEKANSFMKL